MTANLSFGLGDATRNGNTFGSWGTGIADYSVGNSTTSTSMGGTPMPSSTVNPVSSNPMGGGAGNQGPQTGPGWFGEHGKLNTIIGGVQVLGSLWNSFQQHKMAKEQMAFAREQWDTNLANQTQTYNTALEDRIRARHHTEGRAGGETDAYLEKHSL